MENLVGFKGIAKGTNSWVVGENVFACYDGEFREKVYTIIPSGSRFTNLGNGQIIIKPIVLEKGTLCQWTGENDVTGVKIFTKDIVAFKDKMDVARLGEVAFTDGCFVVVATIDNVRTEFLLWEVYDIEIFGNSIDNKNFLKEYTAVPN